MAKRKEIDWKILNDEEDLSSIARGISKYKNEKVIILISNECLDECLIEEQYYECEPVGFQSKNVKQRNSDFYKSQKQENKELEEALDALTKDNYG